MVFSRQPKEEARQKKWGRKFGGKGGVVLATELIQHTLRQAAASGLPVLTVFSGKQEGNTFGERLSHAMEEGFAQGYQKLIVCGTDSPSIDSHQLAMVAKKLEQHHLVLGPASDGGIYLLGIRKEAFCREDFLQVPWLTDAVLSSLLAFARCRRLSSTLESEAADIDSPASVLFWESGHAAGWFKLFARHLFYTFQRFRYFFFQTGFFSQQTIHATALRGPPWLQLSLASSHSL